MLVNCVVYQDGKKLAGIYGMNFKHIPELDWWLGYPTAIVVMVLIDLYLYVRFRRAGWL